MEKYKLKVKKRIKIIIVLICIIGACIPILFYLQHGFFKVGNVSDFVAGMQVGGLVGVLCVLFFSLLDSRKSIKNNDFCEKQYIKETDERTQIIQLMSASFCFSSAILILALGFIIAAFFSLTVAFTLMSVMILVLILNLSSSLYFEKHN